MNGDFIEGRRVEKYDTGKKVQNNNLNPSYVAQTSENMRYLKRTMEILQGHLRLPRDNFEVTVYLHHGAVHVEAEDWNGTYFFSKSKKDGLERMICLTPHLQDNRLWASLLLNDQWYNLTLKEAQTKK